MSQSRQPRGPLERKSHPAPDTWVQQVRILKYNGMALSLSSKPSPRIHPIATQHTKSPHSALSIATMSYHGYQGQTGHHEPYPPYPDQWATHPNTYGLPSWDHTYGYHQRATHGLVSEIPRTLAADNGVGNAVAVDCISLMTLTSLASICSPRAIWGVSVERRPAGHGRIRGPAIWASSRCECCHHPRLRRRPVYAASDHGTLRYVGFMCYKAMMFD